MSRHASPLLRWAPLVAAVALVAAGCSSYRLQRQAELAESRERWDEAVVRYLDLAERDPGNARWRSALLRARLRASQEHFAAGRRFHEAGVLERAMIEYQRVVQLDPTNQYAQVELEKVRAEIARAREGESAALSLDEMKKKTRDQPAQPPMLNPRSQERISLDFPEPQSLFAIYQALAKAFGINVLFDPQLRDQEMAIELRQVTAQSALETLMRAAGHFYKVIDEQTILIAQDTQQNRRTYEDLVIQTFYLSNAEVKDAVQLLRGLIASRNLSANEQLNAVTIRDTADKVKIAQRILETIDKSRSEVVIDIELIEIDSAKLVELGVSLDSYQITQSLDLGEDVPIRLSDLTNLTQQSWALTIPTILYDFLKTNTDFQLLAKPQLRITEGEKAKLRIGDQVPIPVTTFNSSNTIGTSIVPITSFQYKDVGINIDLEPRVHHNKEISLKLQVEISQVTGSVDAGGGQKQPIIGNRTIEATIRLKDGETNFLAGLIRTDEVVGQTGIPGLSDIPVLGKLFSKSTTDRKRTDIMLTLTPHIIRTPDITEEDLLPIWVGTESNMTFRGGSPRVESPAEGPFDEVPQDDVELEEQLRRSAEEEQKRREQEQEESEPPPAGVSLVPGGAPSSPFVQPQEPAEPPAEEEVFEPEEEPPARAAAGSFPSLPTGTPLSTVPGSPTTTGQGAGVKLALQPAVASLVTGELFALDLVVDARVPVAHLPATLAFDPALLAVERVDDGGFLGGSGAAQVLADSSTPGTVVLGASRLGQRPGVAGSGKVARITFRALANGTTAVRFADRRVLDPQLLEIASVEATGASVEVRSDAGREPPRDGGAPPPER
jgi:general secretion pathway protein D